MKKLLLAAFALLFAWPAQAQTVRQSGNVTPTHATAWTTNGVVQDAGTETNPFITTFGILNGTGGGFCILSAAPTSAGYQKFCLGTTTSGGAVLSTQNFGTASPQGISFLINGVTTPIRTQVSDITLYVDKDQGNDANACTSPGAGACKTSAQALTLLETQYDLVGTSKIKWGCASTPCTYTTGLVCTGHVFTGGLITLEGDTATPSNITIAPTAASEPFKIDCLGRWLVQGFTVSSANASINAVNCTSNGASTQVTAMVFGSLNGGNHMKSNNCKMDHVSSATATTVTGNAASLMRCADLADCHIVGSVIFSGTPTFSAGVLAVHGPSIIGSDSSHFSGAANGPACVADLLGLIDMAGTCASIGNGTKNQANGGYIN